MSDIYFLDANIILYASGAPSAYTDPCRTILSRVAEHAIAATIDVNITQEILHVSIRKGRDAAGREAIEMLLEIIEPVLPIEAADIPAMLHLAKSVPGLDAQDALHVAVMKRHNINTIITADKRFQAVPGLTALDPHTAATMLGREAAD